jgi:hypothetical protein
MTASPRQLLRTALDVRLDDTARRWMATATAAAEAVNLPATSAAYTAAPRHVGRDLLGLTSAEALSLASATSGVSFARWTRYDAARAIVTLSVADHAPPDVFSAAALSWFDQGDTLEQQSWLKTLPLVPQPERFLPQAIDACRTNIVPLFEAIACENPYPSRSFPDLHFNQLVMKAMFLGVALSRVVGLAPRLNTELTRMARDFAAERRAAGRPVPADLPMATGDDGRHKRDAP